MKVYIVTSDWGYDGFENRFVTLSLEKATAMRDKLDSFRRWDTVEIEEHIIDDEEKVK